MISPQPEFTVFTPTFNRGTTLPAVYAALEAQTHRNFEWLIIDDGSTDDTRELVSGWQLLASFPIRYFLQENGGKHRAFNHGVRQARGRFFLPLDSDDVCLPQALERLVFHWETIPAEEQALFSGVTALCQDPAGRIVGSGLPRAVIDADPLALRYSYRVRGEQWGFQRTNVLRRFPYPEIPGEYFVPESLVWNRIGRKYRTRYVNEALRIYQPGDDSLSRRSVRLRVGSPEATLLYYREILDQPRLPWPGRFKAAINLVRFGWHTGRLAEVAARTKRKVWLGLAFPLGWALFKRDGQQQ